MQYTIQSCRILLTTSATNVCIDLQLSHEARFILSANANAIRMLTSQICNELFAACSSTLLNSLANNLSLRKEGCDVKDTSHSLRIREPVWSGKDVPLCWSSSNIFGCNIPCILWVDNDFFIPFNLGNKTLSAFPDSLILRWSYNFWTM